MNSARHGRTRPCPWPARGGASVPGRGRRSRLIPHASRTRSSPSRCRRSGRLCWAVRPAPPCRRSLRARYRTRAFRTGDRGRRTPAPRNRGRPTRCGPPARPRRSRPAGRPTAKSGPATIQLTPLSRAVNTSDMNDLPEPVAAAIDAANANDTAAFLACFATDGVVDDWGREFHGADEIRGWSDRDRRPGAQRRNCRDRDGGRRGLQRPESLHVRRRGRPPGSDDDPGIGSGVEAMSLGPPAGL